MSVDLNSLIDPASVRAAIDLTYTADHLPDEAVALAIFVGPAIAALLGYYPAAADVDNDADKQRVANALNRLIAAEVLPALPQLKTQRTAGGSAYERDLKTTDERVADLRQKAFDALSSFLDDDGIPTFFDVASGYRGL